MKLFYFVRLLIALSIFQSMLFAGINQKSAVVYYGNEIPYPMVGIHDYIIVEPKNIELYTTGFEKYKKSIYAYLSINEIIKKDFDSDDSVQSDWIIGENPAWDSYVLDISNIDYQNYLFKKIKKLRKNGFKNFFFDTVDSYNLANQTDEEKKVLQKSVIKFIKKFHKKFPKSKLIINRGFEIIDDVYPFIEALLFESYYKGLNSKSLEYTDVSDKDREWLDTKLKKVKSHKIPIIALDYLPLTDKDEVEENLKALQKKGFIPYVAEKSLTHVGYSSKNAFKREVLIVYNSKDLEDGFLMSSNAHLYASMPLEYMGYIPILKDVHKELPKIVSNRYAGVIVWLEKPIDDYNKLMMWINSCISQGTKVLILGDNSIDLKNTHLQELGLSAVKNLAPKDSKSNITSISNIMNYETKAVIHYHKYLIEVNEKHIPYMEYKNSQDQLSTIAAKTSWGGFVRGDALQSDFFGDNTMWIVNPFKLFRETLELQHFPVPDPTTENGKRLAFLHVDGDGSMNRVENNVSMFSIEIIEKDFISKYKFPQSISIVESETAPYGKYPKLSRRLEEAAKRIYKNTHVEGATHTFTHPYFWQKLELDPTNEHYRTHWKIDYTFTPKREIIDSLKYIDRRLMPKGKKSTPIVFWSGDCFPSKNIIKYIAKNNILNINGGDTIITNDKPWLQLVQSFGIKYGNYYQIYTGQQNENVYTNDWLGPFWGFKKAIQTYNLTESPRRLKPIDVYYHFYSGSKRASYIALKDVYEWVLKQDVMHIYTSQYPKKVTDFYDASLYKSGNSWLLKGFQDLRTVRIDKNFGKVDIKNSTGVVGYKNHKNVRYIHLDEKKKKILKLTKKRKNQNYLVSANARVVKHKKDDYYFKGEMPISVSFHLKKGCYLKATPEPNSQKSHNSIVNIGLNEKKDIHVTIICK